MTRRGEFKLITDLFAPLATAPGAHGLRDDASYIKPSPGHTLVLKTDTIIAGVHFRHEDPADLVARKALRVNLSDLAAKGARPLGVLQALTLGPKTDDAFLDLYARGLGEDLKTFGISLLGGDTTSHRSGGEGPLTISITAVGEVPEGQALLRIGAQPDDLLCVSGTIGDAAIGLRALQGQLPPLRETHRAHIIDRYLLPRPRLALGHALRGIATSCLDVSDGLIADVGHICESSGVSAEVIWSAVPRSQAVDRALMDDPSLRDLVLGGGDDYELAFTVPADRRRALFEAASASGTAVAVIGAIGAKPAERSAEKQNDVTVRGDFGQEIDVAMPGFSHT
jgi:thiamine-monophosphate kinase